MGDPERHLHRLLTQMARIDAGAPFDVLIVCNGGLERPLALPRRFDNLRARIINRKNEGYNLAAWDSGWRAAKDYEFYLFLQTECVLRRTNWLSDFEFRISNEVGIGLLGEHIEWDRQAWDYIRKSTARDLGEQIASEIDTYKTLLEKAGIPLGEAGSHLQSTILFTSRKVLEEVDGFPFIGPSYREAVACEIGFSRLVESKGYRISRIRSGDYAVIGHRQWTSDGKTSSRYKLRWMALGLLGKLVPSKVKTFLKKWRDQNSAPARSK